MKRKRERGRVSDIQIDEKERGRKLERMQEGGEQPAHGWEGSIKRGGERGRERRGR